MSENPFRAPRELLTFDLDGTLVDTLKDIAQSVNETRRRHDHAPLDDLTVQSAIGDGARVLCQRTLGDLSDSESNLDDLFREFREIYGRRSLEDPRFYPGAREFLDAVAPKHQLAVLTNKPLGITEPLMERLGVAKLFVRIVAPENARAQKPDPAGLIDLLASLRIAPRAAVHIGDSTKDFAAGQGAGVTTIGVRGGYYIPGAPDPDVWVDGFGELLNLWQEAAAERR